MKRLTLAFMTAVMVLSLSSCGSADTSDKETVAVSEKVSVEEVKKEESVAKEASQDKEETSKDAVTDVAEAEGSKEEAKDTAAAEVSKEEAKDAAAAEGSKEEEKDTAAAEGSKEEATDPAVAGASKEAAAAESTTEKAGYGRILYVGDSRSVDLFSADAEEIRNEVHDGITVYCKDACQFQYMVDAVNEYGMDNFDTLVSWMGCNNFGDFSEYGPYYDQLIAQGKKLVVCTVGPTVDEELLIDEDYLYYPNANQINYNNSLKTWANGKDVKLVDLYTYIDNSSSISVVPGDGIHYLPKPTTEIWNYILQNLK